MTVTTHTQRPEIRSCVESPRGRKLEKKILWIYLTSHASSPRAGATREHMITWWTSHQSRLDVCVENEGKDENKKAKCVNSFIIKTVHVINTHKRARTMLRHRESVTLSSSSASKTCALLQDGIYWPAYFGTTLFPLCLHVNYCFCFQSHVLFNAGKSRY